MLIFTIAQLDITLEFFLFYYVYISACNLVSVVFVCDCNKGLCVCMRRRDQIELLPFNSEPERTLN